MKINNIDTQDISVVVQGAIDKINTPLCLSSIRKILPGAEIILSTWEGSDVDDLDYDIIIFNKDPGKDPGFKQRTLNFGRQIYSTVNGIKKSSKKYVLKTRSDIVFNDNNFIKYFDKFNKYEDKYKVFKSRIIIPSYHTRSSDSIYLFHPSDWCHFGYREDVLNLFDIDLPNIRNNTYLKNHHPAKSKNLLVDQFSNYVYTKYYGEQYIFVSCLLKNNKSISFKDYTDITIKSKNLSDHFIINNFVVLDYNKNFNITFKKYIIKKEDITNQHKILNHYDYLLLYKKFCDNNYKIDYNVNIIQKLKIETSIDNFRKYWKITFKPLEKFVKFFIKWLKEFVLMLYYVIRIILNITANLWKLYRKE